MNATVADYELVRELRTGNHGRYHLARPPARLGLRDELVLLKVLSGPVSGRARERAVRELRAFCTARPDHLVRILDAGEQDGVLFYAMEHFPLGSLADPAGPVGRDDVLRAVACAARAAHALHEAGLAHRDIRPENVLLTHGGAKLADLGLAQALQPGVTMTGLGAVDSVEYVDPALLLGGRASRSSDVYALGATLNRALSGESLFGTLPAQQPLLAVRIVLSTPPRASSALSPQDARLVEACTSAEPSRRPPAAEAVAERLEALVDELPAAVPPGESGRVDARDVQCCRR